jgi:hypothetical protein
VPCRRQAREIDWDPISGLHQGQRPERLHQRPNTWLHPNASLRWQIPLAMRASSIHGTNSPCGTDAWNVSNWGFNCRGSGTGIPPEVSREHPGLAIAPRMDAAVLAVDTPRPTCSRRDARSQSPRAVSSSQAYRKCGQRRAAMRGIEPCGRCGAPKAARLCSLHVFW